jgi:anti-sigma factor RsiW
MTASTEHLTEDERHDLADGTAPPDILARVREHLRTCDSCAADVGRLSSFMTRIHESTTATEPMTDDLWPGIRNRIDQNKLVPLPVSPDGRSASHTRRRVAWLVAAAAAVALILAGFVRSRGETWSGIATLSLPDSTMSLVAIVDSTHAEEREAQELLNKIELQRALLRPEARASLDRDLRVVDVAISELKDAIARDPNNPALRRLLASSYRQKIDLLKRVGNAS